MNQEIEEYIMQKIVDCIIFDFSDDTKNSLYNFNLNVLESLKNIILVYVKKGFISREVKNNLYNFLFVARDIKKEERSERIKIINEIIGILNNQEEDVSLVFYRIQLYFRTQNKRYLFKESNEEIIKEIDNVHESICYDLDVISSHLEEIEEEEFIKKHLQEMVNNEIYYKSLNMILVDKPELLKNKMFYDRMMTILSYNSFINKDLDKYNKKIIKQVNKKVKRIK